MIMRTKYSKTGMMKYLSHLDLVRLFERALRRAKIPIAFSQGYNPHPMISFASPLSIGVSSEAEHFDLVLAEPVDENEFTHKMNLVLPNEVCIMKAKFYNEKKLTSLMKESALLTYHIEIRTAEPISTDEIKKSIDVFMDKNDVFITKIIKKNKYKHRKQAKSTKVNIRPLIHSFTIKSITEEGLILSLEIYNSDSGTVKPIIVCENWLQIADLSLDVEDFMIHRKEVMKLNDKGEYEVILK